MTKQLIILIGPPGSGKSTYCQSLPSYKRISQDDMGKLNHFEEFKRAVNLKKDIIYGEVIGEGIQKGYHYGHKTPHFILFDVKVFRNDGTWKWLSPREVKEYAESRGFEMIKTLYNGPYRKTIIESLLSGKDDYYPDHIKEGIVIKSEDSYNNKSMSSRKAALKYINPEYLDKNQTDFH